MSKLFVWMFFCLVLGVLNCRASDRDDDDDSFFYREYDSSFYQETMDGVKVVTNALSGVRAVPCPLEGGPAVNASSASEMSGCQNFYKKLYAKPEVNFTIVIGSADPDLFENGEKKGPYDHYISPVIRDHVMQACDDNAKYFACGFKQDPDDATILRKDIIDPNGQQHSVVIHLTNSTVDSDYRKLKGPLKIRQIEQSARAKAMFHQGLQSSDVVFYSGHARDGGGPDFSTARRTSDGHIDYAWYRAHQPGYKDLLQDLSQRQDGGPAVLGLFACDTNKHFYDGIAKASKGTTFIGTTNKLSAAESIRGLTGALDGLLGERCEPDFSKEMNMITPALPGCDIISVMGNQRP